MTRRGSRFWLAGVFSMVAAVAACSSGDAVDSPTGEASGSETATGGKSDDLFNLGGGDGSGASGSTSAGSTDGSGSSSSGGGTDGSGSTTGSGSDGSGATGADGSGATVATGGSTIDVGSGGGGNTIDTAGGSGGTADMGSGGTADLASGGTADLGSGGTTDLGSGGTTDLGTGGTVDICIPTCVPDLLGSGEEAVNLVVFEDANASGCDTEGRMWVGGNAELEGYGVGAQLSECDAETPVLVVGGDLTVTGGVKGRVWVGGTFSGTTPQCGGVWDDQPPPVDFPDVQNTLTAYSALMAGYPVNGTASYEGSVLVLTGDKEDINVIEIDGADLLAAGSIRIEAPLTSSVIVNVTGDTAGFSGGTMTLPDNNTCGSGAVELDDFCNQLIWNFTEATTVSVGSTAVQGSILAPHATMTASGSGQVNGTVIVANFNISSCIEMHPHYFNGCLCTEELDSPYACCP